MYQNISKQIQASNKYPQKIYISRRSWKHKNYDNIGTNYTSRRELVNETELVEFLQSLGYIEVFTELLSIKDKVAMFKNASDIVGPIGGGLCNVLFGNKKTNLTAIISPFFLDINQRFKYSFAKVNTTYFTDTNHVENTRLKQHMRVKIKEKNIIGEVEKIDADKVSVSYSTNNVSGWNAQSKYNTITLNEGQIESIDPGLNSSWRLDINKFIKEFINVARS